MSERRSRGGRHELLGTLEVPAGQTLLLRPGCRLSLRPAPGEGAALTVLGTLVAWGTRENPVVLEGTDWRGLAVLGEGRALLRHVLVEGSSSYAVSVLGRGRLRALGLKTRGCRGGVYAAGRALARVGRSRLEAGELAVRQESRRPLRLVGVEARGGAAGASVSGASLRAKDCAFSSPGAALDLSGAGARLAARGGRLGPGGDGVRVGGGRAVLRGVAVEGCETGLNARGGELRAEDARISGCRVGALAAGGRLVLRGSRIRGGAQGLRAEGGELLARETQVGGASAAAALCDGPSAFLLLEGCSLRDSPAGLAAPRGHAHAGPGCSFEDCGRPAEAGPEARLCLAPAPRPEIPAPARRAVLALAEFPPARAALAAAGAAAAGALAAAARLEPSCRAACLWRGWTAGRWEPGVSDLDAVWLEERLETPRAELLWRRWRRAKALAPFLGEFLLAEEADSEAFAAHGGCRAADLARAFPLKGSLPSPAFPPRPEDFLAEAALALTRAYECLFDRRDPWPALARHAAKAALDLLRHARAARGEGPPPPRGAALDAERDGDLWRRELSDLAAARPERRDAALARLCVRLLERFERAALPSGSAEGPRARRAELSAGRLVPAEEARVESWRRALDGRAAAFLADDRDRTLALLEGSAPPDEALAGALASWAALRRLAPDPEPLPVVLTARAWEAWRLLPVDEHPGLWAEVPGDGAPLSRQAGPRRPGSRRLAWGRWPGAAPGAGEASRTARRAAAAFLLGWRWNSGPGADGPRARERLAGRVLGLRLALERGLHAPLFDLAALAELCEREGLGPGRPEEHENPAWLDGQARALRRALP